MSNAHPSPDLAAYRRAMSMTPPQLASELRDLLGAKLVTYMGKANATRDVRQWADGTLPINEKDIGLLRVAYRAARLITEYDTPAVAQAWFQGRNPLLDDQPPAVLLREGNLADVGPKILAAARAHASGGGLG